MQINCLFHASPLNGLPVGYDLPIDLSTLAVPPRLLFFVPAVFHSESELPAFGISLTRMHQFQMSRFIQEALSIRAPPEHLIEHRCPGGSCLRCMHWNAHLDGVCLTRDTDPRTHTHTRTDVLVEVQAYHKHDGCVDDCTHAPVHVKA